MKPKVCLACYGRLADIVVEVYKTLDVPAELVIYQALITEETIIPQELDDVDVFLSSGINGDILKSKTNKPVVLMDVRIPDIMSAVYDAMKEDPSPLIVPYKEKFNCIDLINSISSIKLEQRPFSSHEELWSIIEDFKNSGGKAIVGTALGCDYAEQLGIKGFFIRPKEALLSYINQAVDVASALKKESLKNAELLTIINYFDRGLILSQADIVHVANSEAAKIFSYTKRPLIGDSLKSLFNDVRFDSKPVDIDGITSATMNVICKIDGKKYLTDFIPIKLKNASDNIMINLRSIESVDGARALLQSELQNKGFLAKYTFEDMPTKSPLFSRVSNIANRYSQTDESIVILGESGVGKEVMASAIHNNSKRAAYPFIAVNCSAMNEKLLESELFGYEEGAFTGAKKGGKKGIFELADKGTIFLDEIGEINETIQVKLLRAIQEKEIMRVGGSKIIHFDARVICATNRNLWSLVEERKFREDLYYRLNVLEMTLPPLRDRQEDIYTLFSLFISREMPSLTPILNENQAGITALLNSYSWPGNIRELQNFAKMVSAMMTNGSSKEELFMIMNDNIAIRNKRAKKEDIKDTQPKDINMGYLPRSKKEMEYEKICKALVQTGGNRTEASKILGISRATLWKRIKLYNIEL